MVEKSVVTAGADRGMAAKVGVGSRHQNQAALLWGVLWLLLNTLATLEPPIPDPWLIVEGQQRGEDDVRFDYNTSTDQTLGHRLTRG